MQKNQLYFDIAATTPLDPKVIEHINEINQIAYGNPSSVHQIGQKSHNIIERARKDMATQLSCLPSELYFTSGGSESNNIALRGILNPGDHLITSSYEHPAISEVAKYLEKNDVEVSYVKPNLDGIIITDDIKNEIKSNTKLVSILYVNNELGSINPISDIADLCKSKNILFHTDAVQYIGKKTINLNKTSIDLLSLGAHKFYGPKGIGGLYIKSGVSVNPSIFGGGQERSIRPGTENISLISGMAFALNIATKEFSKNTAHITKMENLFFELLDETSIKYKINGSPRMPGFINITFFEYDGHSLLLNLDMKNIAISFGSACSSGSAKASSSLLSIGMDENTARHTVRISIGKFIQKKDITKLVKSIQEIIIK